MVWCNNLTVIYLYLQKLRVENMNNDGKITCSKCGKKVPWDQSYPGFLCYDCAKGLKKPNEGKKKDSKEGKPTLGAKILKFLLLI